MHSRSLALLLAAAALAACASDAPPSSRNANPASEMAPPGQDPGRMAGSTAEQDCLFAVGAQLGVDPSTLSVQSASMGENFTTVLVDAPRAQAPWVCEWGGNGVARVYYGAEG